MALSSKNDFVSLRNTDIEMSMIFFILDPLYLDPYLILIFHFGFFFKNIIRKIRRKFKIDEKGYSKGFLVFK